MADKIIAIGSDHAGFELKEKVKSELGKLGFSALDCGTNSSDSVDYPDFGAAVAKAIINKKADMGIVICGSGVGISIAANRFPQIRAALVHNSEVAKLAREHNDANVLALGARVIDEKTALAAVRAFLTTAFEGGRHQKRVEKLSNLP